MTSENSSTTDWDFLFRKELNFVFDKTKELIIKKIDKSNTIIELTSIADSFFKTFAQSPIPVYKPNPELYRNEDYISTSIDLPFSCFMVPYFFYEALRENINFDLDAEFSQSLPWSELLGIINQKWLMERKKLTKTDVFICKVLSRYNSKNQAYKYPITINIISNRSRLSLSSIEKTFHTLFSRIIVTDFFIINPWKLGWELYLISYSYSHDKSLSEFDQITLSKEILLNNFAFRIIQIPFLKKNDDLNRIRKTINNIEGTISLIESTSFHWELGQLEPREDKSFLNVPDFHHVPVVPIEPCISFSFEKDSLNWLRESDFSSKKSNKKLFKKSLENRLDIDRIIKILNFIIQYGIPLNSLEKTATELGISEQELSKQIQFLIKNNVISLAYRFRFIGAGMEYSFLIENGTSEIFNSLSQSFLQCPFSYIYRCDSVLAGRVQVPNSWVSKFLEYLTTIQLRNPTIKIKIGQRILGYNFFSPNVKLPKDYVLNEFGAYSKAK